MTLSGFAVHFTTIARWKRGGWKTDTNDDHPLDVARTTIESFAPLLSGDPMATIQDIKDAGASKSEMEQLSDAELLRKTSKELCILSNVMMKVILEQIELVSEI
jgi:hypothetical protein